LGEPERHRFIESRRRVSAGYLDTACERETLLPTAGPLSVPIAAVNDQRLGSYRSATRPRGELVPTDERLGISR
jgi:hypothetical protein